MEYSLCYAAKGDDLRYIQVNVDTGPDDYRSLMGSGFTPEVGAATRGAGASLTRRYHRFRHRFISPEADGWATPESRLPWRRATSTCRPTTSACTRGAGAARPEVLGTHGMRLGAGRGRTSRNEAVWHGGVIVSWL